MGLDMYLTRHVFVGGHKYNEMMKPPKITIPGVNPKKVETIVEDAMYWRKANAIHAWFVKNVQEDNDNCATYWVGYEQLKELYDTVSIVLEAHAKGDDTIAETQLPPQAGFFFGSTELDEYYWEDLEATQKELGAILKADKDTSGIDYYYHSSW